MINDKNVGVIKDDADYLLDLDFNHLEYEFNIGGLDGVDVSFLGFWTKLRDYCVGRRWKRNCRGESLVETCSMGEANDDNDPEYGLVWNNLMECGKAYALKAEKEDGTIMHLKYEEEDSIDKPRRKVRGHPRGFVAKGEKDIGISTSREKNVPRSSPSFSKNSSCKEKEAELANMNSTIRERNAPGSTPKFSEKSTCKRKHTKFATTNSIFRGKDAPRFSPRIAENSSPKVRDSVVNNHYFQQASRAAQMFDYGYLLNNLKVQGESAVFVYNGDVVRYEEVGEECSSDPEIRADADPAPPYDAGRQPTLTMGKDCSSDTNIRTAAEPALPCDTGRQPAPKVDSKKFSSPDEKVRKRQRPYKSAKSLFRSQVISVLKKPYSQEELEDLKEKASCRKPIDRHRESRSGVKFIKSNQLGKSLLDHHPEVRDKIQAAADPHRTLNLLRGLFFWLQYLTMEGSFQPWQDPDCLEVVPESNWRM